MGQFAAIFRLQKSNTMIRHVCLAACLALLAAVPNSASAYWPYMGYGGGWGWGNIQPTNYIPAPPYFAVHPPVYYSHQITARHYGASPFAWLPGMQPIAYVPEMGAVRRPVVALGKGDPVAQWGAAPSVAVVIENPYVAKKSEADEAVAEVAPLRLDNPFFAAVK